MDATPALQELSRADSLEHLREARIARVAVSIDALPAVFPVFITVIDGRIVFRTVPGTKLVAALVQAIVAVEADRVDEATGRGWSVLVRGIASEVTDPDLAAVARRRLGTSWIDGAPEHFVEVSTDLVTGRRLA